MTESIIPTTTTITSTTTTTTTTTTSKPEFKDKSKTFRVYEEGTRVAEFYRENHTKQTVEANLKFRSDILPPRRFKLSMFDVITKLDDILDQSDPDISSAQIIHAIQTAEACRSALPDCDWFHLVGFIHDLGKVMTDKELYDLPQWATTGDTFPVGCAYNEDIVHHNYFQANPDNTNEKYNTKLGMYKENCGFENIMMSWGHDEYMYQVLKNTKGCTLPSDALYTIRYHSFYVWHSYGGYSHLANEYDWKMLPMIQMLQKCDLYSKRDEKLDLDKYLPYYKELIAKYFASGVELEW
jgi:inositol oxygenase